ncbi:MAG: hypothetical protein WBO70_03755 [Erysipelotrichaceae bacterium]
MVEFDHFKKTKQMTPKEKALQLCNRFMFTNSYQSIVWYNARICGLMAAEEQLKTLEELDDRWHSCQENKMTSIFATEIDYWLNVTAEIEKL